MTSYAKQLNNKKKRQMRRHTNHNKQDMQILKSNNTGTHDNKIKSLKKILPKMKKSKKKKGIQTP